MVIQGSEVCVTFNDNVTMEELWPLNLEDRKVCAPQITFADLKRKSCFSR